MSAMGVAAGPLPFDLKHGDRVARVPSEPKTYAAKGVAGFPDAVEYAIGRALRTGIRQRVTLSRGRCTVGRWFVQAYR